MKSILLSIRPEWVAKILNGEKTIEVRRKFPLNYVGWVYIYCTKGKPYLFRKWVRDLAFWQEKDINKEDTLNGKVVARFWCDKVEEMYTDENGMSYYTDTIKKDYMVSKLACLDDSDIETYLGGKIGYAIHITKLEIFDEPKELKEFHKVGYEKLNNILWDNCCTDINTFERLDEDYQIKRAPENMCYVETE